MLKKIRVGLSVILFSLITFYFLDFAGILPTGFHVLAHLQFVPALVSIGMGIGALILIVLVVLTLVFGRIYCSTLCPMGVYQDIVSWMSKRTAKKKKRYKYKKARTLLRWGVVVVVFTAFFAGFTVLLGLLDPYSAYGRMVTHVFKPVYMLGNNLLASIFSSFGNYTFYRVDISVLSISSLVVAVITLFTIGFLAWKYGRTYCNTICPVGTILGFFSKYALFRVRIDVGKCNSCGLCAAKCKASCIDTKSKLVDHSRCVDCFNCVGSCKQSALKYALPTKKMKAVESNEPEDTSKRYFVLAGLATVIAVPKMLTANKSKILTGGESYVRKTPISPPGAISAEHLLQHCTSCHLCISKCPSKVIKPSFLEYGVGGMMQPIMYYEKGFCNYSCTVCTDVCPNGALVKLTQEEKKLTQIGRVVFNEDICVVHTDGTNCGACAEHCPTQAVKMVPYKDGLTIPFIDPDICVGCGGCEFICPVRPYRAIHVEGNLVQQQAEPFDEGEKVEVIIDDFGF